MTRTMMSGRIIFIPCPCADGFGFGGSSLARLQFPDVFDQLIDLCVAEARTERRHRARLAVLDAVAKNVVASFRVHELWSLAGGAAPIGMTPATGRCEQLVGIECPVVRRRGSRLRLSRHGT